MRIEHLQEAQSEEPKNAEGRDSNPTNQQTCGKAKAEPETTIDHMDIETLTQENQWKIPWITIIIVFGILIALTIGCVQVFPQYSSRFLTLILIAIIIGLFFPAIFALNKKWRVKLHEYFLNYQTKTQKPSGSRYRKAQVFNFIMLASLIILGVIVANDPSIINNQHVQYMFFALFVAFVVSFIVYVTYLLKTFWKWGLILIMIGVAVAVIRILFR